MSLLRCCIVCASIVVVMLSSAPAAADRWATACEARLEDARIAYNGSLSDWGRADLAEWQRSSSRDAVRLRNTWWDLDYQIAVTATREPAHAWRARWVHGESWFERVEHGRLASIRASGTIGIRERADVWRAFQPALEACLKQ